VRIDGVAIDVLGLKLVIRLKAVDGLLQRVKSPDSVPDGFSDRGLGVRVQQGPDGIRGNEHGVKRWMSAMLIEPRHIGPGASAFLGRCRPFGAKTYRIKTRRITRDDRFEANVTLPMGAVIIDIPEALTATETQGAQPNVSGVSPVAPIVLAVEVERVEMLAAPVKDDLEHGMEVRQGGVAAEEKSAPDERTDLVQDDTQLIDTRQFRWLAHRLSVAQCAVSLKVSPRNLALSVPRPCLQCQYVLQHREP